MFKTNILKMECYIDFLDSKNKFRVTRKDFENYESAVIWMNKNLEKSNTDYIKYY